jgi:hypothetical protein
MTYVSFIHSREGGYYRRVENHQHARYNKYLRQNVFAFEPRLHQCYHYWHSMFKLTVTLIQCTKRITPLRI